MRRLMVVAVAAAVALAFLVSLSAQAGNIVFTSPKKSDPPAADKGPADPSGPIGTPGSDKTIKAHVLALEIAVAALKVKFSNLSSSNANLQARFTNLSSTVGKIASNNALGLGPFVSVDTSTSQGADGVFGPNITFKGANIRITNGNNSQVTSVVNGLGNLIIGYDEPPAAASRGGSHNLVVGPGNNFSSFGGFVAGSNNTVSGQDASVSGGENNTASGNFSVVVGGNGNSATATDQIKP